MKLRAVELTVGAFMIAGILSLLMLALQVSGLGHLFHEEPGYRVHAEFSNIGGLKVRAKVSVAGVVVGRVEKIILQPETYYAKVIFTINPNRIEKVPGDSRASIMTSGLLGDNYIALTPGFDDTNLLKEGSVIPVTNTDSAVVLEQLISKFVANQASKHEVSKETKEVAAKETETTEIKETKAAEIKASKETNEIKESNEIKATKEAESENQSGSNEPNSDINTVGASHEAS